MVPSEPLVWHLLIGCQVVLLDICLLIDTFSSTPRWGNVLLPPDFYSSNCIFSELGIYFQFFLSFIHSHPCLLTYFLIQLVLFAWFKFHVTTLNSRVISKVLSFLFFLKEEFYSPLFYVARNFNVADRGHGLFLLFCLVLHAYTLSYSQRPPLP